MMNLHQKFLSLRLWMNTRPDVKQKIKDRKIEEAKTKKEDQAVEKAIENAEMDIPQPMIDLQVKQMADDFAMRIQQQGLSLEQYFQFTGMTAEKMMEELQPQAEKRIKTRLVLEAVAKAEDIQVTEERLDEELAKMAEQYQMEVEKLKELIGRSGDRADEGRHCCTGCSDIPGRFCC